MSIGERVIGEVEGNKGGVGMHHYISFKKPHTSGDFDKHKVFLSIFYEKSKKTLKCNTTTSLPP